MPNRIRDIWVIDQVWGQDGWILAKFFFCVFMERDGVEVHLDRTSLVTKGFIIWLSRKCFLRDTAGKIALSCPLGWPITGQDLVHLARSRSWPYDNGTYKTRLSLVQFHFSIICFIACRIAYYSEWNTQRSQLLSARRLGVCHVLLHNYIIAELRRPEGPPSGAPYSYGKEKETHELIFSWLPWLAVLLVGAYARRRRRRRSCPTWRPYSK